MKLRKGEIGMRVPYVGYFSSDFYLAILRCWSDKTMAVFLLSQCKG